MLHLQLLGVPQLYRICTTYWDDDYNTSSVSPEVSTSHYLYCCLHCFSIRKHDSASYLQVIANMKEVMTGVKEEDLVGDKPDKAILLDDNTR